MTALSVTGSEVMSWLAATGAEDIPATGQGKCMTGLPSLQLLRTEASCLLAAGMRTRGWYLLVSMLHASFVLSCVGHVQPRQGC